MEHPCPSRAHEVRHGKVLSPDHYVHPSLVRNGSASQTLARRENAVLLANALERLPPDYRDVLVLRHLEGLGFSEVARRMSRTVDSVKNLWSRSLGELRHLLEEWQ